MMTVARQRRAEVNRARQFFREPQLKEGRKAQLDKLKQKFPCARCGQLGHWKDNDDCPAKLKVVNWEETEESVTSFALSVVCLGTATLWTCRRSSCASPMAHLRA